MSTTFEWDERKEADNKAKHGLDFKTAQYAFFDPNRLIVHDSEHSELGERCFCIGKVDDLVLTVRFTYRDGMIRIFGVAQWRKWREFYEQHNS